MSDAHAARSLWPLGAGACGRGADVAKRSWAMQALPVSELVRTVALCVARVLYVTCVDLGRVHLHPSSGRANVERVFTRMLSGIYSYTYTLV